jgi:hypothetical protein
MYYFSFVVARTKPLPVEEVLKIFCMMKFVILCTYLGPAMFLLYHSDRCNTSETVFHWCYVNDLHTTHAVVCWVTTISDLQAFVQRRDLLLGVNGDVVRLQFYRYSLSNLTSPSRLWSFLMVAARRIILAIFIPAATSSAMVIRTLGSPAASTRLFGLFSPEY